MQHHGKLTSHVRMAASHTMTRLLDVLWTGALPLHSSIASTAVWLHASAIGESGALPRMSATSSGSKHCTLLAAALGSGSNYL
jgi:hypothetical protein